MSMSNIDNNTTATTKRRSIREMTPEQTAEAIKNVARNIRESSYKMREAVRAIRKSGAIDELTEAVREATIAARDTAKEISDTAKDMKERGVIRETINAAEDINLTARETAETVRDTVSRTRQSEVTSSDASERTTSRSRTKEATPL
jgi:hypothetical protein